MRPLLLALLALLGLVAAGQPQGRPIPGMVRVRLVTSEGTILVALDAKRAPRTTANFLVYVDDGRFDGTWFYRAARRKTDPKFGFIQGGIGTDARRMRPSVVLERTSVTGIRHLDGTLSMAHGPNPNSANGNFSIMVGANPGLDKDYAAFGRVLSGMDVVRRILAKPSAGGRGAMVGQMITNPVRLIRAERLDGTAKPSGGPKTWLLTPWQ